MSYLKREKYVTVVAPDIPTLTAVLSGASILWKAANIPKLDFYRIISNSSNFSSLQGLKERTGGGE